MPKSVRAEKVYKASLARMALCVMLAALTFVARGRWNVCSSAMQ